MGPRIREDKEGEGRADPKLPLPLVAVVGQMEFRGWAGFKTCPYGCDSEMSVSVGL